MTTTGRTPMVDQYRVKFGMGVTSVLLALGFVFNSWALVALAAASQLLSAANAPFAPYKLLYEHIIVPNGIIKPKIEPDNPEPHRFANLVGGLFDTTAVILLFAGVPVVPWVLVGIVIVLANLNIWVDFCMGCWMYYQLNRLGVPGFTAAPVKSL